MILTVSTWGSLNVRDPADQLLARSHQVTQQGYVQAFPMETPSALNMEHTEEGIAQRRGTELDTDDVVALLDGDTLLGGFSWHNPSDNSEIEFLVSTRTFYTNQSGSWAQLNASSSTSYVHAATVSACQYSFVTVDGHLLIPLGGANDIQAYRSGADLDASVTSGATWETAYTATNPAVTGTWGQGKYIATAIHGRLAFTDGNTLLEYTPMAQTSSSGVWDLAGGTAGTFFADGPIRMVASHNPGGGDPKDTVLYAGTANGLAITSGFQDYDRMEEQIDPEAPLNHRAHFSARNWLVYLTREKNLKAAAGGRVIDLGRRLRNIQGSGPLDLMNVAQSETYSFGVYDPEREIGFLSISTGAARINDSLIVIDFKMGEPVAGEPVEVYERRVRLQHWQIISPDDNAWFIHIYRRESDLIGVMSNGKLYKFSTSKNDLDGLAIDARHAWPDITGGDLLQPRQKQWFRLDQSSKSAGNWQVTTNVYLNRSASAFESYDWDQVNQGAFIVGTSQVGDALGNGGMVRNFRRVGHRSEVIRFENTNAELDENFVLQSAALTFEPLEIVR